MARPALLLFFLAFYGCGSVSQSMASISKYRDLIVGQDNGSQRTVELLDIQRVGDPQGAYQPKLENGSLHLRSGKYTVRLKCHPRSDDTGYVFTRPATSPLGPDGSYTFDIEDDDFAIDCKMTNTGQVLVTSGPLAVID